VLMDSQERLVADIKDTESRFKIREAQGKQEEAGFQEKLRVVETELALVRTERAELTRQLPQPCWPTTTSCSRRVAASPSRRWSSRTSAAGAA